jgi:hypothetical protein
LRPVIVTVGPLAAASANNIALTQTPTAAFTLNGSTVTNGVATLDQPRRVLFTTADSTHTATITGTNWSGSPISETVAMNGTSVATVLDYKTVISIVANALFTAAVTVGTNGVAASAWVRFDEWALPQISVQSVATGTVNYTLQQTLDDPNDPTNPVLPQSVYWQQTSDATGQGATGSIQSNYAFCPRYGRVLLNSGTGTVTTTYLQSGVAPY